MGIIRLIWLLKDEVARAKSTVTPNSPGRRSLPFGLIHAFYVKSLPIME